MKRTSKTQITFAALATPDAGGATSWRHQTGRDGARSQRKMKSSSKTEITFAALATPDAGEAISWRHQTEGTEPVAKANTTARPREIRCVKRWQHQTL